jgi:hypothetical protein
MGYELTERDSTHGRSMDTFLFSCGMKHRSGSSHASRYPHYPLHLVIRRHGCEPDCSPISSEVHSPHSFIKLACEKCDDSLPFSGDSSSPLCYIPFHSTLFHQLVFHPPSFILPSSSWSIFQPCCFRIHM